MEKVLRLHRINLCSLNQAKKKAHTNISVESKQSSSACSWYLRWSTISVGVLVKSEVV